MTDAAVDGRVARGNRTREAVIETLLALYAEGNLTPTIEDIAERIGKTARSIYHHFKDKEALAVAMGAYQLEQHRELYVARPVTGSRAERVDGIVDHRATLFETIAPARRSALIRMHVSPEIQSQQTALAAHLRKQLSHTFEPELSTLDRSQRNDVLDLLDLHTSWETWERLRTWQGLSAKRSRKLVTKLLIDALPTLDAE